MFRDGPLSRRPPEEIRYGTGKCALGRLLVALSDKGIVTIMVRDAQAKLLRDLRARFPKAELIHAAKGGSTSGCSTRLSSRVAFAPDSSTFRGDADDQVLLQHRPQPHEGGALPGGDGPRLRPCSRGHAQG